MPKENITRAGYDYNAVQAEVNKILSKKFDCTSTEQHFFKMLPEQ
ncbi:MAG: hypothetical protein K2G88_08845 [Oscillospiraceae bacterium]|nr:hypothetical protein [Oscillospiraceae bacterium]